MTTLTPPAIEIAPVLSRITPGVGNHQHVYRFANGYGASVVKGAHTYGGDAGLWELGVIAFSGPGPDDWRLTYDTPITGDTGDVIGWLDTDEVARLLLLISALPERAA